MTFATGVGPKEAASNLSEWAIYLGLPELATYLAQNPIDDWVMAGGAATASFALAMLVQPYLLKLSRRVRHGKLKKVYNRAFSNQVIVLDGHLYDGCTFSNVTLRWHGGQCFVINSKVLGYTRFETTNTDFVRLIDILKTLGFLNPQFASSWQHEPEEYFEENKVVGRTGAIAKTEDKVAIYNSTITYNTYYLDSGAKKIIIRSSDKSYSDKSNTFVKFRASGEILDSKNISSITDNGLSNYTINFSTNLNKETLVCTPVGDTPRNFRVVGIAAGSVNVQFDEPEPEPIHLKFED